VTANRLSPAASSTSIRLVNRVSKRLNMNAIRVARWSSTVRSSTEEVALFSSA
jgi:hypothetical protein